MCRAGDHTEQHSVGQETQGDGENVGKSLYVASLGRMDEAGKAVLELASWNNFNRFWGIGAVPGSVVCGPGVIRAGN